MASKTKPQDMSLYAYALARVGLGFVFLWAFLDKAFGLGFATCRDAATNVVSKGCEAAWVNGGSPTKGFLTHGTQGPFADTFQSLAGKGWVDWLFMIGLLGIGVGLILGIAMRLSTLAGSILLFLMWLSALWPANNPLIDDHIIYILVLMGLMWGNVSQKWGLRAWWVKQPIVKKYPILE